MLISFEMSSMITIKSKITKSLIILLEFLLTLPNESLEEAFNNFFSTQQSLELKLKFKNTGSWIREKFSLIV